MVEVRGELWKIVRGLSVDTFEISILLEVLDTDTINVYMIV